MKKSDIRKSIKDFPKVSKVSIKKHTLINNAVKIIVEVTKGGYTSTIGTGNVYSTEFYNQHFELFKYLEAINKTFLDETGEKIITL